MTDFYDKIDQIPFEDLGGRQELYDSYSLVMPYIDFNERNSSYGVRQSVTINEDVQPSTEKINLGVAPFWYADVVFEMSNDLGNYPDSMMYGGSRFFKSDRNIEFLLEEDFNLEEARDLETALEP